MIKSAYTQRELLEMHIEALFTLDSESKLVSINEPWDKSRPAPRFYLGKTTDASIIYKYSAITKIKVIEKLEEIVLKEKSIENNDVIIFLNDYAAILESNDITNEIFYYAEIPSNKVIGDCNIITEKNINSINLENFEWLMEEINCCQPCCTIVENDRIMSICRSVRKTEYAHEAGIETIEEKRRTGLAKRVLSNWIKAVEGLRLIPFYSTSLENTASRKLAQKIGLKKLGLGVSIV